MLLAEVAIPVPLARAFTYAVPAGLATMEPGSRVVCRFHRRSVLGVVLDVADREPPVGVRLRPIDEVVDDAPSVPLELLRFLQELAAYYLAPIGEVLRAALPALERKRASQLRQQGLLAGKAGKEVGGRMVLVVSATPASAQSVKLRGVAPAVLAHLRANGPAPIARLCDVFPAARGAVKRLESLGLVTVEQRELPADPFFRYPVPRDEPPEPTEAQREAIEAIVAAVHASQARSYLVHGITGSGKTEVYLRAIAACLQRNAGALVLVPEIALTPQLVGRFRARFGDGVAVLHSGLTDRARYEMWKALREDRVRVAVGARSAIFAPVPRLGLVVVDEEHDGSFKQEEGVRYQARDMALLRAHRAGAVCVLGSATPVLESEFLCRQEKLHRLSLPTRATTAALPEVQLVDLRRTGPGPGGHTLLSLPLHRAIEQALAKEEQIILFLNRRGFAPSIQCEACGDVVQCPTCSVSTTLHRTGGMRMRCHYCDYEAPMPAACPACGCERLAMLGLGTERLEEILTMSFPDARVVRMDRDVASGAKSEAVIDKMRRKQADILVGTQMVTKGHDLPGVTVVGVINADAALSLPDFRAAERTFQLLVQVAGRAGRADKPGRVIVQTRIPDHAVLQRAKHHDVLGFVALELENRREAGYPPFARLALVRLDGADEQRVRLEAERLANVARAFAEERRHQVDVLGPSPAPLERLRGRYRFRVLLRAAERPALRAVARAVVRSLQDASRLVRVSVDIDPVHMM